MQKLLRSLLIALFGIFLSSLPVSAYTESGGVVSGSSRFAVSVASVIAMTIEGNCDRLVATDSTVDSCSQTSIMPNSYGSLSTDVTVYTNSKGGYKLSVRSLDNPALVSETDNKITAGVLSSEAGGQGVWSYKTDGIIKSWTKMLETDVTIKDNPELVPEGDKTIVTYGVSATKGQIAGTYTTKLVFTATAYDNGERTPEVEVPAFWQISNMQQMNESVCNSVYTPAAVMGDEVRLIDKDSAKAGGYTATTSGTSQVPETTLIDVRDGNTYRVRKLADGNCWMVENLRLEFDGKTELTSRDTNVASSITPDATQPADATDLEKEIWKTTNANRTKENVDRWLSKASDLTVNVGDETQKTGTFYNFYTAVAGTVDYNLTNGSIANGDICPANWRLPAYQHSGSFQGLIKDAYHLVEQQGAQSNSVANDMIQDIPISIPASGRVADGVIIDRNSRGYLWINQGIDNTLAFNAYISIRENITMYNNGAGKTAGFPIRCVAKQRNSRFGKKRLRS